MKMKPHSQACDNCALYDAAENKDVIPGVPVGYRRCNLKRLSKVPQWRHKSDWCDNWKSRKNGPQNIA